MEQATDGKKSRMGSWDILGTIVILVSEGIALSGKVSMTASLICFLTAWIFTLLLIFRIFPLTQYPRFLPFCWSTTTVAFYFFTQFMRPEVIPQYYGLLTPRPDPLFSIQGGKFRQMEIGDSRAILRYTGPEGTPLFKILSDSFLTVELIKEQLKVSTTIRDSSGKVIAKLIRNEWQVAPYPGSLDLNYTADALEIRDTRDIIVLQVRVLPDRIQLQGEWWDETGHGIRLVQDHIRGEGHILHLDKANNRNPQPQIEPIFEYPSKTHFGQMKTPPPTSTPAP